MLRTLVRASQQCPPWCVPMVLLLVTLVGCMRDLPPPPGLDTSLTRSSAQGRFVVALQPKLEPLPVNQIHAWEIRISTPAGEPVEHAAIEIGGGMPQHRHGFPTKPQVTRELGEGRYLLEGMKFNMTGWWEIKLHIRSAVGEDAITFNTVLAPKQHAS